MDNHRVGVALLAYTGMRISEACALRWQDSVAATGVLIGGVGWG